MSPSASKKRPFRISPGKGGQIQQIKTHDTQLHLNFRFAKNH